MFINYILTAWRNLLKNKMVSAINILGLTLGLASAVLAILYAKHELTYETCHENYKNLYQVFISGKFGEMQNIPASFGPEGKALMNMFPEVEKYSISRQTSGTVRVGENIFYENQITVADSTFFDFFTIPFIEGGPKINSLSVVISEKVA
jgi:putative ABC transport system permease protein